jgi:ATP-dependent helicase Lhr and Lhr-like helicase
VTNDRAARLALKKRLGRTWAAFFERHGNFTAIQLAAIPVLLDGHNAMLCSPTASGKTEAVIVPLIERHCLPGFADLTILYLTPTRALVNDLLGRLTLPLKSLGISLASKTHDANTFNPKKPSHVLITTPESFDSLLTSQAQVFANLRAVVIDELHLFDQTARGDQLRALLRRLQQIRQYAATHGESTNAEVQYIALSATLPNPQQTITRYFDHAQVIHAEGNRTLQMELLPITEDSAAEFLDYLGSFRAKCWRKALVFCNSRQEAESYATAVRQKSPFGDAVYVHYSNIAPQRRLEIEARFATDDVALCFATNTLELGIDVGNIDVVILIGPPGNSQSFSQRVGRGNRRQPIQHVACFYKTPLERLTFETFNNTELEFVPGFAGGFRLSVAVQQIFSLIKQSPSGGVRLSMLSQLFDGLIIPADLESVLGHLQQLGYLKIGRPGEWRPDAHLNELFDQQASDYCELSIYGNIQSSNTRPLEIRDQHTHEIVASVDQQWLHNPVLTLEGRAMNVEWADGEAIWVSAYRGEDIADKLRYRGSKKHLSFELAQSLPLQLGLESHKTPLVQTADGWLWFHWVGDLYGHALLMLLQGHISAKRTKSPGTCLRFVDNPRAIVWPTWTTVQIRRFVEDNYSKLESMLDLGAFHHFLPAQLRQQVVVKQFDVPKFVDIVNRLQPMPAPDDLVETLSGLVI